MRSIILIIFAILCFGTCKAQYINGLDIRNFEDETITVRYEPSLFSASLLLADGYTIRLGKSKKKTIAMRGDRRVQLYKLEEIKYFITKYGYELISEDVIMQEHARTGGGEFAVRVLENDRTILVFKNNNN